MNDPKAMLRFTKGARPTLHGLRTIVLDRRSIPCPECDDDGSACLRCLNVGWIIPDAALERNQP